MLAAALASLLLNAAVAPAGATDQDVTRLAAINPANNASQPGPAVTVGTGATFFVADDGVHGSELRVTDGGPSTLVKDIDPGPDGGSVGNLTALGDALYFTAADGVHGLQLWRSDGTAAGTTMVRDDGADANPGNLVASGGRLFFTLNGGDLYVTDGTASATRLTSGLGSVDQVAPFAGGVAFEGDSAAWVSDGTAAGTRPLGAAGGSAPAGFTELDGKVYYSATTVARGRELYGSDGTVARTAIVKDIAPLGDDANPSGLTVAGHLLLFSASDGSTGDGTELWASDGTSSGTRLVKDINTSGDSWPFDLTALGGKVYFSADDGNGSELWRSDGTAAGTTMVKDINSASGSIPGSLTAAGTTLFFGADDGTHGYELWKSDGTAAGTVLVKDLNAGANPGFLDGSMASIGGGRVMFAGDDGTHGSEPWTSDGTAAGTTLDDVDLQGVANPTPSVRLGNQQFYVATPPDGNLQLYVTDGTADGSRQIPGPTGVGGMTVYKRKVYFDGFDSDHGPQLWVTDGTAAGTRRFTDTLGLTVQAGAGTVAVAGRSLYFVADDGVHGFELWKSDGTVAGTVMVKDINSAGHVASNPAWLTALGGRLVFSADDGAHGTELWTSDGTAAGTTLVQDSVGGIGGANPSGLYAFGSKVYYSADDGTHGGPELWASDGTDGGTGMVKDISLDGASSPSGFTAAGGRLYFSADGDDNGDGPELWTTDGTAGGTTLVDGSIHGVAGLTAVGARLVFSAGSKLYGYDPAGAGAPEVLAGAVPIGSGNGTPLAVAGDVAYFANGDAAHGMELWSTDGTVAGTALAEDLNAGPASSFPVPLGAGSNAPVLTTDTPADGTVLVRLGDVHPSPPEPDDPDPTDTGTTTTSTTTTTTTTTATITPPPAPAPPTRTIAQSPPADSRATARGLTVKLTRKTATRAPFRYTVSGTLKLPTGLSARKACTGTVTLALTHGKLTLAHTTAHLTRTCTFKATVVLKSAKRLKAHAGTLKLSVRFAGNTLLRPLTAASTTVRYGR